MALPSATVESQFAEYRRELLVHCYRMLGSVHEAEDLVQETMLRAWRARDRYDPGLASVRTWLYRIATNACLTALRGRARRPLPTGLGGPSDDPGAPLVPRFDIAWLQPFPDALAGDPADRLVRRGGLRLALIAALQRLPARQRAVLVLREVLDFSAAEVAEILDTSTAAVNSALQRARAGVAGTQADDAELTEPADAEARRTLDRYVAAFEAADVDALVGLLTDEVILEMPPVPLWYRGRADYGRFIDRVFALRGNDWRMVPVAANTQPAVAAYFRGERGYQLHTLQVFTVTAGRVSHNVAFQDPRVFELFELPSTLD